MNLYLLLGGVPKSLSICSIRVSSDVSWLSFHLHPVVHPCKSLSILMYTPLLLKAMLVTISGFCVPILFLLYTISLGISFSLFSSNGSSGVFLVCCSVCSLYGSNLITFVGLYVMFSFLHVNMAASRSNWSSDLVRFINACCISPILNAYCL